MNPGGNGGSSGDSFFERMDALYQAMELATIEEEGIKVPPPGSWVPQPFALPHLANVELPHITFSSNASVEPAPLQMPPGIKMYTCELCGVYTTDKNQYEAHMNGKRHAKEVRKEKQEKLDAKTERTLKVDTKAAERLIGRAIGGRRGDYLQKRVRIKEMKEAKAKGLKEKAAAAKEPTKEKPRVIRKLSSRMMQGGSHSYLKQEDHEADIARRFMRESDSESL